MSTLTLRYDLGHVSPPLDPTPDDQITVNQITVKRADGGEHQASVDTGPLSTQAPPDGVGVYDRQLDVNVETDDQLANIAGWALHIGTWDADRYPVIRTNIRALSTKLASLVTDALALDVEANGRIQIEDPPDWLPPETIDQYVLGYTESISVGEWTQDWHTTPSGPLVVFVLDHWVVGRLDTAGSELALAAGASDTQLTVAVDSGKQPWVNTATSGRWPFCVQLGGEVVRVNSILGESSPQTFNVDRSVNGIAKSHAAGTRVRLSWVAPWPEVEEDDVQQRIATTVIDEDSPTFTSETVVTSVTAALVAGRTYRVRHATRWNSTNTGDRVFAIIRPDDIDGDEWTFDNVEIHQTSGQGWPAAGEVEYTPAADETKTFVLTASRSGSGDVNLEAGSNPSYFYVDYIRG